MIEEKEERESKAKANESGFEKKTVPKAERMLPYYRTFPLLLKRFLTNFSRQPAMLWSRLMQILSFGIILCLYFWDTKKDQVGIGNLMNVLWETQALVFVGN